VGWYDDSYKYRAAVTVDNSAGSATGDIQFTVPDDWDHFWDTIQTDGDDIRLVGADGQTLLSYDLSAFTYATRTMTIQVDAATLSGVAGMDLIWLYYGNSSATDGTSVVAIASAKAAYVELGTPSTHRLTAQPERPGTDRPRAYLQKTADEQLYVWWRVDQLLERRGRAYMSSIKYEELYSAVVTVSLAGVSQGAMVTGTKQRFVELFDGSLWVRFFVQAGTTANTYTVEGLLRTVIPDMTQHRILAPRALLRVKNVSEV
jgi:hypothetical protein